MTDPKRTSARRRVTNWVARGTVVAVLAVGTVGYASAHKRIEVDHNGNVVTVTTFGGTVASALEAAGISVADGEIVAPALDQPISDGDQVAVRLVDGGADLITRASAASRSAADQRGPLVNVTVAIDGQSQELATHAADVRTVLKELDVVLVEGDVVSPGLDEVLTDGATVTVASAATETVTVTEEIAFKTKKENDSTLDKGKKVVKTEGTAGERLTTYSVQVVDGVEVSRVEIASAVVSEPRDKVVSVGTKEPFSVPTGAKVQPGSARAIAKKMLKDRGWGDDEFKCLDALWQRESGWRVTAHNTSSGAYGIPQAMPGSKMASAGADWKTSAETQIKWGLGYVKGRYKTPCGAWAHFQAKHWY